MHQESTLWDTPQAEPVSPAEQMFAWAKEHGFPAFSFPLGGSWKGKIREGEESWRGFCDVGDPYGLCIALCTAMPEKNTALWPKKPQTSQFITITKRTVQP
jgi:hypothetical protein